MKTVTNYFIRLTCLGVVVSMAVSPVLSSASSSYTTATFLSSIDSGEGQEATDAYIDEPKGFDVSLGKEIYVVDSTNNSVEKIDTDGKLTTVAGTHQYGLVNGAVGVAQFADPEDVAVYGEGEQVFVADTGNNVIRKIESSTVSTFLSGLSGPKGLALNSDTLFLSDTGNNRILGIDRHGGTATTFASNLDQPTKLLFWQKARSILFVNFGEGTVRALNVNTGTLSDPIISDLEDIGGIFLKGRTLYVAASHDIGVYNQIWKVRLSAPDPSGEVTAVSKKLLSDHRETEHLNWPSDVSVIQDTVSWEEYYTWDKNLLFSDAAKHKVKCLKIRKVGEKAWRSKWFMPIDRKSISQTQDFILKASYQGDRPYFRIKLQYNNKKYSKAHRKHARQKNQTPWKKGIVIQDATLAAPQNLLVQKRRTRKVTLAWDAVDGATDYTVQVWHKSKKIATQKNVAVARAKFTGQDIHSNTAYKFRVRSCTSTCGDWSDYKQFRTPPSTIKKIFPIFPGRGINIVETPSGKFRTTLAFSLRKKNKHLRAKIQLCSTHTKHAASVTKDRIYVMYKGGSAILAWRKNGTKPQLVAGQHRFQDEYGSQTDALVGRPKDVAFTSDGTKMYIAENNKLAVYDMYKKTLSELAGHLMDSYTEGTGGEARFSDISSIVLSHDNATLYVVDRNNHRIRTVDTATGTTHYLTGAGSTNFSFESNESNGYQEGGPCPDEFEQDVAGCAYFNRPTGIALSPDGKTLYVAEGSNNRVRAVEVATGKTSLIAGSGTAAFTDGVGSAASFNGPYSIDVTSDGKTLYVADKYNYAIRQIEVSSHKVTTLVGKGVNGLKNGSFSDAYLAIPEYVEEENGVVYWTEAGSNAVRAAFLSSKTVVTLSGNGSRGFVDGVGTDAKWNNPKGFAFRAGKIYVADSTNDVIRTIQL